MVAGDKPFFGGPKLRRRVRHGLPTVDTLLLSSQTTRRGPSTAFTGPPNFTAIFTRNLLSPAPDRLNPSPRQPATSHDVPPTPSQLSDEASSSSRRQRPETDALRDRKRGIVHAKDGPKVRPSPPTYVSSRTTRLQGYDTSPPHAVTAQVSPTTRKPRYPVLSNERYHLLPVHLVDQLLLSSADHHVAPFHHPPTPTHRALTTSPTTTHPGNH